MSRYGISKKLLCGYEEAVTKAREGLAGEGFRILSEIDLRSAIRESLDKEFRNYTIFSICTPHLDHKAFTIETDIGLLMPFNVIVYENDEGGMTVMGLDPVVALSMIDNPALAIIAKEARGRIERFINSIS